jgi:hypothetical protein
VYETMVKSGDYCNSSAGLYTTLFLEAQIDVVIYSSTMDPLLGPPTTEAGVRAAWDHAATKYPTDGAAAKKEYYKQRKAVWAVSANDYDGYVGPAGCKQPLHLLVAAFSYSWLLLAWMLCAY